MVHLPSAGGSSTQSVKEVILINVIDFTMAGIQRLNDGSAMGGLGLSAGCQE